MKIKNKAPPKRTGILYFYIFTSICLFHLYSLIKNRRFLSSPSFATFFFSPCFSFTMSYISYIIETTHGNVPGPQNALVAIHLFLASSSFSTFMFLCVSLLFFKANYSGLTFFQFCVCVTFPADNHQ